LTFSEPGVIKIHPFGGAVAQLEARLDGIEEVEGSNPFGSTKTQRMPFCVYILQSESNGRYYVGQTQNLEDRVAYHQANYSKYLKNRGPWKFVHFEKFATRVEAARRENYIKRQKDRRFIEALCSASR
jgi:putative endonuclease